MAQDYGAAQPIADVVKSGVQKVEHLFGYGSKPAPAESHPDTNWHSNMVNAATESFRNESAGAGMAKFEQHHERHEVHELNRPQGHGYVDQKYGKGNRSPISGSVPTIDHGAVPGADGAGSPGTPGAEYGSGSGGTM